MVKLVSLITLLRPLQWYKNIVVFIALFFTAQLFDIHGFLLTILGFISLCLISSTNYIINDIIDAKEDRRHPEKRMRSMASGVVKVWQGIVLAFILFSGSVLLAYAIAFQFMLIVIGIFGLTLVYSLWLKNEPFLDVILIGVNFVMRAASGAFIINVEISPWLIICAFFLAIFMAFGKRRSDLALLGKEAAKHRRVFASYTLSTLDILMGSVMATLIIAYALYTFQKAPDNLIITLPIVAYGLYRYLFLVTSGSVIARRPEHLFSDMRMVLSIVVWGLAVLGTIYIR